MLASVQSLYVLFTAWSQQVRPIATILLIACATFDGNHARQTTLFGLNPKSERVMGTNNTPIVYSILTIAWWYTTMVKRHFEILIISLRRTLMQWGTRSTTSGLNSARWHCPMALAWMHREWAQANTFKLRLQSVRRIRWENTRNENRESVRSVLFQATTHQACNGLWNSAESTSLRRYWDCLSSSPCLVKATLMLYSIYLYIWRKCIMLGLSLTLATQLFTWLHSRNVIGVHSMEMCTKPFLQTPQNLAGRMLNYECLSTPITQVTKEHAGPEKVLLFSWIWHRLFGSKKRSNDQNQRLWRWICRNGTRHGMPERAMLFIA